MISMVRWMIFVVLTLSISAFIDGKQCKRIEKPRCLLQDAVDEQNLTTTVHEAITRGRQYLQKQLNVTLNPYGRGWIKTILALTNLHYDSKNCYITTNTTHKVTSVSYEDLEKLNSGELAIVVMSMQATCSFKSKADQYEAVRLLKRKMKGFPNRKFNRFFDYSVGIVALYNNGEYISSKFGRTLINEFFLKKGRYNRLFTNDTKTFALMALKAILQQKFNDQWVEKHAVRILQKTEKQISTVLPKEEDLNTFITLANEFNIRQKSVCKIIIMTILSHQKPDGSFGMIETTIRSLISLNGYPLMVLRDVRCNGW